MGIQLFGALKSVKLWTVTAACASLLLTAALIYRVEGSVRTANENDAVDDRRGSDHRSAGFETPLHFMEACRTG